jgi:putative SOS response-associated peptidase YedK
MCGRFTITHPNEALAALFDAVSGNDLPLGPNYNVCPTNSVVVVTADGGQRRLRSMRWGFIPNWYKAANDGPLIINARSDTVATKPAFREAVRTRRCIVPASGFYEWSEGENGARLPWYFTRSDGQPMALAGLWQRWQDLDTVAIVSTEAGSAMAGIHHREPVVLERESWALWLGEAGHGAAVLMQASAEGVMSGPFRVGVEVNSNRATGPGLIAPVAIQGGLASSSPP